MLIDPALMGIRRGGNSEYLDIDYDRQIGHLPINADGRIIGS